MGGKKLPLEQAHFHINNGGITLRIIEVHNKRKSNIYDRSGWSKEKSLDDPPLKVIGTKTMHNRRWVFEVRTSHFGAGVSFRFPLGNPVMVRWLAEALQRVLARMETDPGELTDGFEYAFRDCRPARLSHFDGEKVDQDWPVPGEESVEKFVSGGDG